MYINIPLFAPNGLIRLNPQHQKSLHKKNKMLPEPLWPGIEFAWAEMIQADLYPVISWTQSKTSQVQDFESICLSNLTSSLWKGWSFCHLLKQRWLHEKEKSLSLQLEGWTPEWGQGPQPLERGDLYWIVLPWKFFSCLFPGFPWHGKILTKSQCRWHFRFWNYYFVLLTSKWHKGWAGVVVFNHFWVTHIFENLMKALYSLPWENQICAHMQNFACKSERFTRRITHPWGLPRVCKPQFKCLWSK